MAMILVKCPRCRQTEVVKHGVDSKGKPRFLCRNQKCDKKTFQLEYELNAKYHRTGKILAYALGRRKDEVYRQLRKLLRPFQIKRLYTDNWGAYTRHPQKGEKLVVSKKNTQRIESKHLNFRTRIKRLVRKTICFSKSFLMHSVVIGLFINRYEFGLI